MRHLQGKVALVTGAASGIGRAIALLLADEGMRLALLDKNAAGLQEVEAAAQERGVEALSIVCDLSDLASVAPACQKARERFGPIDLLVNNAGCCYFGHTARMTARQWDQVLTVNLLAPARLIHELLPEMLARPEAHILNVASIYGLIVTSQCTAYHASKFGLVGLSKSLRLELLRTPVGVTVLCPGFVDTGLFEAMERSDSRRPPPRPPRWVTTTPERVAAKGIAGVKRNRRLVLVTPLAHVLYFLRRLAPALTDRIVRVLVRRR